MALFSVTTKTGQQTNITAEGYEEARQAAAKRFGGNTLDYTVREVYQTPSKTSDHPFFRTSRNN